VLFILFGHRLPSAMRLFGRSVVNARQRASDGDRQIAVRACLILLTFLIGALAMAWLRGIAASSG
jgi:hypothetical protein